MIRILLFVMLGTLAAHAQEHCDHLSNSFERFDMMRLMPAVKVKAFNGKEVEWLWEGASGIKVGTVEIDPETKTDPTFSRDYKKGLWWIMFSTCDQHVYFVTRVDPEQLKTEKRPDADRPRPAAAAAPRTP